MSGASRARRRAEGRQTGGVSRSVREAYEYMIDDSLHGDDLIAAVASELWRSMSPEERASRRRHDVKAFEAEVMRRADESEDYAR